ncbi:transposase [Epilithonimonas pallida]|uniref:Transposase n=1 Tax=Epilithonimonas pallida TaxID=373671 RepID=A0ABY1R5X2_9FLAO|nr:transposase [Epilithonimonas pallida]SMP94186.1 hypothetical protein SAMN05421679_105268 [Epilithonimonas pallida]
MIVDLKNINIGDVIRKGVEESGISVQRISNFFQCSERDIEQMYQSESLDVKLLLRWSKLLEYDFFRLYSQHLILFAPPAVIEKSENQQNKKKLLPQFRKNLYTREIIDFILEQIITGAMTKNQIMDRYRIPKTTLYKWISKYGNLKK